MDTRGETLYNSGLSSPRGRSCEVIEVARATGDKAYYRESCDDRGTLRGAGVPELGLPPSLSRLSRARMAAQAGTELRLERRVYACQPGRYGAMADGYDRAVTLNNTGRELATQGRYQEALAAYDRALEALDPNLFPDITAGIWNNKGSTFSALKRYAEALAAYDRALAIAPYSTVEAGAALRNKASTLRQLGRVAEAEEAERQARALGGR